MIPKMFGTLRHDFNLNSVWWGVAVSNSDVWAMQCFLQCCFLNRNKASPTSKLPSTSGVALVASVRTMLSLGLNSYLTHGLHKWKRKNCPCLVIHQCHIKHTHVQCKWNIAIKIPIVSSYRSTNTNTCNLEQVWKLDTWNKFLPQLNWGWCWHKVSTPDLQ